MSAISMRLRRAGYTAAISLEDSALNCFYYIWLTLSADATSLLKLVSYRSERQFVCGVIQMYSRLSIFIMKPLLEIDTCTGSNAQER